MSSPPSTEYSWFPRTENEIDPDELKRLISEINYFSLFSRIDGTPIPFALAADLPQRKWLKEAIYRSGGAVVGGQRGEGAVEGGQALLVGAAGPGGRGLGATWIVECVKQKTLVDPLPHRFPLQWLENSVPDYLAFFRDGIPLTGAATPPALPPASTPPALSHSPDAGSPPSEGSGDGYEDFSRCLDSKPRPGPSGPTAGKPAKRPFSRSEQVAMLRYIKSVNGFHRIKSKSLFRDMEDALVCPGRAGHSMQANVLRNIPKILDTFSFLSDKEKKKFMYFTQRKDQRHPFSNYNST